ncbi:TPA: N-6 DNA methylase [Bacillus nitratireducens]|uniref:type I restriction-modification system subunit M n=1 Tax=Bacillus cereus group TaxID=86661 RepID=UPI00019FBF69|nr:class I SAM-dependent DNA methyltransferase [Bacillus cereus]EEK43030.1 Type I restriction-modification system methyltransferase subunit [Bacillus cereus m1293]HDR7515555.1 SAM-dependent DNA methyltransferase [Bacillus mobilis]HDR7792214.1 SAM-dependent DNA methyltransferase [Bacillus luti]MDQ4482249.1 class I SAM-dependent DNA methyltransferase [Bacillus cereus]ONG65650.1 restriction endonuclease subunit M [Bacillus cereus]
MERIQNNEFVNFIWKNAEILRGPYKKEEYQEVVLPLCVLRRFDCLLQPTKQQVLERAKVVKHDAILNKITGYDFNNTSQFDFQTLLKDPDNIAANLRNYIQGFSVDIRTIFERFGFDTQIQKMDEHNLLYSVVQVFSGIDLSIQRVSNIQMGYIFEEFIRRFSENAEAGDHYTPREVIQLMVNLVLNEDQSELMQEGKIVQIGDFACGTGGMLSEATRYIQELNPNAQVEVFGQEINPKSYAIACADLLIKGQNAGHIAFGNSLTNTDGHKDLQVRYALMNPPFGVDWKHYGEGIKEEHEEKGKDGRYGAGLPRTSDGSLLFLQHMISKMKRDEKGSRMAIIFNGSPLFTGDAGSGESEIRRWIIEEDLLEGIVALPDQLFYNTGISTYIWILSNRKNDDLVKGAVRKGKIQLVDATSFAEKMRKSLGNKRNEITEPQIAGITRMYGEFKENEYCKIFDLEDFGYHKITVERPLQLNFMISPKRIENLYNEATFAKLYDKEAYTELSRKKDKKPADMKKLEKWDEGKMLQEKILAILQENISDTLYKNREDFLKGLKPLFKNVPEVKAGLWKAIYMGLSERDEIADVCKDTKRKVEADPTLRDTENISLKEDIQEYFGREVLTHVPDAWIDESKTKIGYEIPFTRYFYKYEQLESSSVLKQRAIQLEENIQELLKKVLV